MAGLKLIYQSAVLILYFHLVHGAALFQSYNALPDFIAEKVDGGTRMTLLHYGRISGIETVTQSDEGGDDHVTLITTNGLVLAKTDSDINLTTRALHDTTEDCFISADEATVKEFLYVFDAKFRTIDTEGIIFLMEIPTSELSESLSDVIVESSDGSSLSTDSSVTQTPFIVDRTTVQTNMESDWNQRHGVDNQIPLHLQASFDRLLAVTDYCMETEPRWKRVHAHLDRTGLEPETDVTKPRARRAPGIYPGTLWCGVGDFASSFDDMGVHADTDACCRDHDFCPHNILPFQNKFGYFNFRPYSVNHCDCDESLRQCFRDVNTTISDAIARLFFNVFKPVCFELEERETCTARYWYGLCYEYGTMQYAITRENLPWSSWTDSEYLED